MLAQDNVAHDRGHGVLMAERQQDTILRVLQARFGTVPQAVISALRKVTKKRQLDQLTDEAAVSPTLESFRSKLES
jgi:hypothetical protein